MRIFLVLLFSILLQTTKAQDDSLALRDAIVKLDQALLKKDSAALDQLLYGNLSFGHSNGWVQAKGRLKEKEFDLKLTVLQVWKKDKKGWQLFARQSAKID